MESHTQQQILILINKMRTQQVNEAQQKLMSLVNNPQFMQSIFNIIINPQLQNWVRTIASTFLNRVITEKLQQLGYKTMFSAIRNIMSSYQILPQDKRCFQRSLIKLIQYIKQPEQIQEWLDFINIYINDPLLFDTGLLLISCSAIADINNSYLCMIIQNTYEQTLKRLVVNVQNSFVVNQLIKNWIVVFDKLRSIQEDEYVQNIMMNMCKSPNIAKIIYQILQLECPPQIWLCIKPQLYQLNLLKHEAAQRILLYQQYDLVLRKYSQHATKTKLSIFNCPLISLIMDSYNILKNTIAIVGTNMQILQNYQCEDLITSLFGLLCVHVENNTKPSKQQMQILMHIVCYPFLRTREQQMYIFEQSPVEFNSLMQDLCDKQHFGILKTQAARLLETIGDYCLEALQSSIIFCVQCIKMKMGFVPTIQNSEIKILQIQVAFQILSLHSFSLQKYPSQIQALKVILLDKRLMQLPSIDISKVFLFLAYNYGQIFNNPIDGTIWIQFTFKYNKHPTTRYIGLDFLSNIADQYFSEYFMMEFISLINRCEQRQSGQIWSILSKILQHQLSNICEQLCLNLVNNIFLRIQQQISKILILKNKESSLDIVNGFHILRKIIQNQEYVSNKFILTKRILDIKNVYSQLIQLNIEDQIIKIIIQYLKLYKTVPNQVYSMLKQILGQFKNTQYNQKQYFILLNHLILKGQYNKLKPILKSLLTGLMFHLFDMSTKGQKLKQNVSIANLLTLIQNFIPIHGYQMVSQTQNCFVQIQSIAMRLFPDKDSKIYNKQLLAKALNLMLLCHIYNRSENTISYLLLYAKQNIFHKYDAYVLIKLLTKSLFTQQNIQIVIQYLNLMIDITNEQQVNIKKDSKIAKTAKGKLRLRRQQQLNKLLQKIHTPFLQDIVIIKRNQKYPLKKQVQQSIIKMKTQNIDTYKLIIMNMNQQRKSKLTLLLNQIALVEGKNRVIRKVIGIKSISQNNNQQKQYEQNNKNQDDLQQQDDNDESNNFKRSRLMKKKKQNKKIKNKNNIAQQ